MHLCMHACMQRSYWLHATIPSYVERQIDGTMFLQKMYSVSEKKVALIVTSTHLVESHNVVNISSAFAIRASKCLPREGLHRHGPG